MPHISTAMHRSLRRGVADIVFGSLQRRGSITNEVSSIKNTFSSWSNCMAQSYCKWPVIAAIIVAGLMVFSIVWCIIRCACCGMSCCCTCFSFLKCCDCCGGCCDGRKDKPMKHLDDPYSPQQGYQAPAPMMGGALGGRTEPPHYAQFEVGKNGMAVTPSGNVLSEDALPPMPSWETATKKHVLTEEEKNAVELGELDPATGQHVPLMAGAAGSGISPTPSPGPDRGNSPYGARPGQAGGNGYMGIASDPYAQSQTSLIQNAGYGGLAPQGMGNGGPGRSYGPPSPQEMGGQGRGYGPPSPQEMGGQGRGYGPPSQSPQEMGAQGRGYGPQSTQDPYRNNNGFGSVTPGGYGRSQPEYQSSNDGYNNRPFPPQPQRQYSSDSSRPLNPGRQYSDRSYGPGNLPPSGGPRRPSNAPSSFQASGAPRRPSNAPGRPGRMGPPALTNNSGFDFGSGGQQPNSSRPSPPQQYSYGSSQGARSSPPLQQGGFQGGRTAPPSYASRSPPPQDPSYPGHQRYQPASSQGAMQGGGRGGAAPQNWDPVER